jgi:hypothetical protein
LQNTNFKVGFQGEKSLAQPCPVNKTAEPWYFVLAGLFFVGLLGVLAWAMGKSWFELNSFLLLFFICLVVGVLLILAIGPRFLLPLFMAGFFLRVSLAIGVYYYLVTYYGFKGLEGNDDLYWNSVAKMLVSGKVSWHEALQEYFSVGFSFLTAAVYEIGGVNFLNPRIVNSLFGALIPVASYHLTQEIFADEKLSRRVANWLTFLPVLLFWSTAFHKDILICLCMTVGIYACVRLYKRGISIVVFAWLFVSIVLMILLRTFAGYILVLSSMVAVAYRAKRRNILTGVLGILVFSVFIAGVGVIIYKGMGREETADIQGGILDRSASFEKSSEKIAAGRGVSSILTSLPRPVRLVIGPVITLLSPIPPGFAWKKSFGYSCMSLFQPLQFLILPFILLGFSRAVIQTNARTAGALLLLPAIGITLISNSFYAVGQITKYRIMVEPLLIILAVWAYHTSSLRIRQYCLVIALSAPLLMMAVYIILRSFL